MGTLIGRGKHDLKREDGEKEEARRTCWEKYQKKKKVATLVLFGAI